MSSTIGVPRGMPRSRAWAAASIAAAVPSAAAFAGLMTASPPARTQLACSPT